MPGVRQLFLYLGCPMAVAGLTLLAGFTARQVMAATIFTGFIAWTLLFWKFRLAFALGGVAVLLAAGVLDLPHLIEFAGLDVILFLVGMMVVIGFLERRRFFEVVTEAILRSVGGGAQRVIGALMVLAALSAA
ncbi:MAG: SLC13 family permease, partial [Candidatus Methylomirabilales bacterium]